MEKINSIKNIYIRKKAQIIIIIIIIGLVFCQGLSFIQPLTISLSLQHCFSWSASFLSALVTLSPSLKSKIITVHKNTLVWIFLQFNTWQTSTVISTRGVKIPSCRFRAVLPFFCLSMKYRATCKDWVAKASFNNSCKLEKWTCQLCPAL